VRAFIAINVHLTLKFLGDVEDERHGHVESAVREAVAGFAPFELTLDGFGAFPSLRSPRVLWAGIEPTAALEGVQAAVESAMAELGFPRETRDFHPHVTLGRARRDARPSRFADLPGAIEWLTHADTMMVRAVDLMRSRLSATGAEYDVVYSAALEG
jgi:2'-5' RNA ligase